ncbi:MAG: alpha-galactosidase [Ruminococcaceae bacterium]|nr:alpha-galactosidase [Oscillospiraceae bacterium]
MRRIGSYIALFLAFCTVISLFACGGEGEITESETEAQSEIAESEFLGIGNVDAGVSDYLTSHSDYAAARAWIKEKITESNAPPVYFLIGGKSSESLNWTREIGEPTSVTDYVESDSPAVRRCCEIKYVCAEENIEVLLTLTAYGNYPVVEYDAVLKNTAAGNSEVTTDLLAINTDIYSYSDSIDIHYNEGGHYEFTSFAPYTKRLSKDEGFALATTDGLSSDVYLPYFNVEDSSSEKGVIAVINWQGDWEAEYSVKDGSVVMKGGQGKTEIAMTEGESLSFPGIVLLFYKNGDWQYGQNVWRRWMIEHNFLRNTGRRDFKQNVFLCSGFTGTEDDVATLKKIAESNLLKKFNCTFEYDAGWYENYTGDWHYTGTYTPAANYSEEGFKQIGELCKEAGIGLCFWFEPERAYHRSEQAKALGDNMIYVSDEGEYLTYEEYLRERYKLSDGLWDLHENAMVNYGNKACRDYVVDLISNQVKNYGMTLYRQDFNRSNDVHWNAYDVHEAETLGIPRTGATENHAAPGYIDTWTMMSEQNKGLLFDACAGGGRRLDLETVRFAIAHTKTDYWKDAAANQCQNFGAYSWYIFTGTGFRDTSDIYDIRSSLNLSVGLGVTPDSNLSAIENVLTEWESIQTYLYNDYYQISKYTTDEFGSLAMQFHDHENNKGMMIGYLRAGGVYRFVAKGLDPQKTYKVYDRDNIQGIRIMSGEQLMTKGFTVAYPEDAAYAVIIDYSESDRPAGDFDEEKFLKEAGYVDYDSFEKAYINEKAFTELYKGQNISDNELVFLGSDAEGSGGIYGVGKELFAKLDKTGPVNDEGWTRILSESLSIKYAEGKIYEFSEMAEGTKNDIRVYAKETDGCCFIWFDNSYGLGDADVRWKTGERQLGVKVSGTTEWSGSFEFKVCNYEEIGGRDIQYVAKDGQPVKGSVYEISREIYEQLEKKKTKKTINGYFWYELVYDGASLILPLNYEVYNEDDPSLYSKVSLKALNAIYNVSFYVAEKNGKCYLWMRDAENLNTFYTEDRGFARSSRWTFCFVGKDGKLYRKTFFAVIPGGNPQGTRTVPDLITFG